MACALRDVWEAAYFFIGTGFFHCLCAVRKGKSPAFTAGLLSAGGRAAAEAVARPDVFLC